MKSYILMNQRFLAIALAVVGLAVALFMGDPSALVVGAIAGMIMDKHAEFSDSQVVTVTAISTNVIDLGDDVTLRNIGGKDLFLVVQTDVAITDGSSDATLAVTLESDSTADLATSPTVHLSTGALAFATYSPAGTVVAVLALPYGDYERYLGVRYTVASGPFTAGSLSAFLTRDPQYWRAVQANNPTSHN